MTTRRHRSMFVGTILVVAIVIGGFLRFLYLPWMEFKVDEFRALGLAILNVHDPLVPTSVISSIGIPNPPFFIYLLSVPAIFTSDPVLLTAFVALLNVLGLLLFFLFLRRFFNVETALWSVALLSTAPWAIVFSRKLWAQDLLIPFLILFLWLFFSYRERPTTIKAVGAFVSLAILTQLHMSAWFLVIPLVIFCALFDAKVTFRHACLGVGIFLILYLPYLLYLFRDGVGTFQPMASGSYFEHPLWSLSLLGSLGFPYLIGEHAHATLVTLPLSLTLVLSGVVALCAIAATLKPFVERQKTPDIVLFSAMTVLTVTFLYVILGIPAFPHYHIILLPFLILLLVRMSRRFPIFLTIVIIANAVFSFGLLRFIREHPTAIAGDYGTPYILEQDRWETEIESLNVTMLYGKES